MRNLTLFLNTHLERIRIGFIKVFTTLETTKPEETTIVKNVSKDVILFSDFEDETLKTKLLGLGAKFRKSISKKVTVIVFDDNKMNLKKTKTKIANAQKYDIAVFNRTDFNTYLTTS